MASSSSSLQISSISNSDLRRLFTVIARPRNNAHAQFGAHSTLEELAQQLSANGMLCPVTFVGPNYIIGASNPQLQATILSWSPLETRNNTFDFVAWSKEDERAQLPWIIGNAEDYSCIKIDPLAILPHTTKEESSYGTSKLKDSFAKMMDQCYDLKAPDFSYLMINELKDYYGAKHDIVILCKKIIVDMVSSMQQILPLLQTADYHIKQATVHLTTMHAADKAEPSFDYLARTTAAIVTATGFIAQLDSFTEALSGLSHVPINLNGYKEIPPLSEIPVPPSYVTRLQTIHRIATKYLYGVESIVDTIKSGDIGFEAYMKIGEYTHKYNSLPMKSPATAKTAAIYESLKYITNVLGFRILDYNYPTLQLIVSAIRANNVSIHTMQIYVNTIVSNSQSMSEAFSHFPPAMPSPYLHTEKSYLLHKSMSILIAAIEDHHAAATTSFHRFMDRKQQYLTTFLNTESPIAVPSRWIDLSDSNIQ